MSNYSHKLAVLLLLTCFFTPVLATNLAYWQGKLAQAQQLMDKKEYKEALDIFTLIAEETASQYAQVQIAWIYHNGLGVEVSCKDAVRWYTHAANQDNPTALNNLWSIYSEGCEDLQPNRKLALNYLQRSSQNGNPRAQANLAAIYSEGNDIEKNPYQAYDLAQKSANQGDISGIVLLSSFYENGVGVPIDHKQSFELLNRAVSMDIADHDRFNQQYARLLLGEYFYHGIGTPQNNTSAYQWFLLAASGSDSSLSNKAKHKLAQLEQKLTAFERNSASNQAQNKDEKNQIASSSDMELALYQAIERNNTVSAINAAKILSSQNNPIGQLILGNMFYDGYGSINKDLDEAYILFKRSCQAGEWGACLKQVSVLIDQNRKSEARNLATNVMKNIPKNDESKIAAAKIMIHLDKLNEAEDLARQVLLGDPVNTLAKQILDDVKKIQSKSKSLNN